MLLRLERAGGKVRALCSREGREWLTLGSTDFPIGPSQIGVFAVGQIDRSVYPGEHPDGGAIRIEILRLCEGPSTSPNS
jgi:hypothetical protein